MDDSLRGLAVTLLAGGIGSSTLLPMKFVRRWRWENTWLVYSVFAYFLFPWIAALVSVPRVFTLYGDVPIGSVLWIVRFELLWGVGVVLYGLAVDIVGLSLSSGIILGCSVTVGSLAPLLVVEPARLLTRSGVLVMAADVTMLFGLALCARAGHLREQTVSRFDRRPGQPHFVYGLVLCFVSGLLAPLLNVALTLGADITRLPVERGASSLWAANSVWGPVVSAGAIPSIVHCSLCLRRNRAWREFGVPESRTNVLLCLLMGVFFIASTALYGTAAGLLGRLGPVVGWPVYVSALILGNNFWGYMTGEWKGARGVPVWTMVAGIITQVVGIAVLSNWQ